MELPQDFDSWSLERKQKFLSEIKYNWEYWARPEQIEPPDSEWDIWALLAGRGFGKLAALDEVTSTPSGWKKLGDIEVGDQVFSADGSITNVTGVYDATPERAYRLTFDDGLTLDCGGEHLWTTWTHRDRKQYQRYGKPTDYPTEWWSFVGELRDRYQNVVGRYGPEVRDTDELYKTQTIGARGDANHSIPVTKSLRCTEIKREIDPYALGVWLGDGSSSSSSITIGGEDSDDMLQQLSLVGWKPSSCSDITYYFSGVRSFLVSENVFNNKHIPDHWLRASVDQRLSLVQGLMDTDGGLTNYGKSSHVEFCSTSPHIASGMMELLRSLGQLPRASWSEASYKKEDGTKVICKDRCRIKFRPTVQVFRLPRKVQALEAAWQRCGSQELRHKARMIKKIESIDPVPMRCIEVDHPSHLYLIGEGMIPTHNTRTGAEYIKKVMLETPAIRIGIIGQTIAAVRDVCVEGESGLLAVIPDHLVHKYNRSLGQLILKNGSRAHSFSGTDPEKLRGFQSHYLWMDELAAWQYEQSTFDMALMGLRLGTHPRIVITTTPKPSMLIVDLVNRSKSEPDKVRITTGSTFDNAANLPDSQLAALRARYEGTTLGRQELYAELILDDPNALWTRTIIDKTRMKEFSIKAKNLVEVVVAIDPSMSALGERDSETGIIIAGRGQDGHCYILEDATLLRPSPDTWARHAIDRFKYYQANRIVAEVNQGYDLVVNLLNTTDANVPVKRVYATRGGKFLRAEPIAALYEQEKVHHVGMFPQLEDQMTQWIPGKPSPDRLDAMVWAVTQLMLGGGLAEFHSPSGLPSLPGFV